MTETPTHTPLPCPSPWCASHQTTDPQIRAFHAPIVVPRGKLYQVACPVCPAQTPLYATEAEALTAWNTRDNSHHRLVEVLEAARKIIADIDDYMKRPSRGDWGEECACCMGELLDDDRETIAKIDAALKEARHD